MSNLSFTFGIIFVCVCAILFLVNCHFFFVPGPRLCCPASFFILYLFPGLPLSSVAKDCTLYGEPQALTYTTCTHSSLLLPVTVSGYCFELCCRVITDDVFSRGVPQDVGSTQKKTLHRNCYFKCVLFR